MIASIYLDRNNEVVQPWQRKIMEYRQHKGYAMSIAAYSNCHSTLFGHETNKRGEILEEFFTTNRPFLENQGRNCSTGRSIIDITLTMRLAVTVNNWRVADKEINFSDHNSIYFELKTDRYYPPKARKWHLADRTLFREDMENNNIRIQSDITPARLEACLDQWYDQINHALNKACPKRKVRTKDLNDPWWSKELQNERRELKTYYRLKIAHPTETTKQDYRDKFNLFRKNCRQAKTKDWRQFVENTGDFNDMNKLRKILERGKQNTLGVLSKNDGTQTVPGKDTLDYLLHSHYPSLEPTSDYIILDTKISTATINATKIPGIDLLNVFNKFKSKKSPGPDQLKPLVLKELPANKLQELIFIYKAMLLLKFTPTKWRSSKVTWKRLL